MCTAVQLGHYLVDPIAHLSEGAPPCNFPGSAGLGCAVPPPVTVLSLNGVWRIHAGGCRGLCVGAMKDVPSVSTPDSVVVEIKQSPVAPATGVVTFRNTGHEYLDGREFVAAFGARSFSVSLQFDDKASCELHTIDANYDFDRMTGSLNLFEVLPFSCPPRELDYCKGSLTTGLAEILESPKR